MVHGAAIQIETWLCTNLFDGRIRKKIENTKTATWLLPCSPTN